MSGELPPPPGDLGLPFVGEGLSFAQNPFAFYAERFDRHGRVFKTRLFGGEVVCFMGAEAFAVFNDPENFTREKSSPPHVQELFHTDAIPFLGGKPQAKRRKLLMKAFTKEALEGYLPVVRQVFERYVARWNKKKEVAGVEEFSLMCFALSNALFTGADPDRDDPELAATFMDFGAGIFSIPINLPFTTFGKAIRARDTLRVHVGKAVDAYEIGSANHVMERLCAASAGEDKLTREEIKIELLHFFLAAHGATMAGLVRLTRALADHPEVVKKTRAAIEAGDSKYVSQVTKEARRAYKIAPSTFFGRALRDCEIEGYAIPKGWKGVGILHSTMRDRDAFPRPADFDPDRFADGDPPGYVAHGSGPWSGHRCAGEHLADLMLDTYVEILYAAHDVELPDQDFSELVGGFTPLPRDGLRMRVRVSS